MGASHVIRRLVVPAIKRQTSNPRPTPAKAQWASASLKKAMRLPTTSDPIAPQMKQTTTVASRMHVHIVVVSRQKVSAGQIGSCRDQVDDQ